MIIVDWKEVFVYRFHHQHIAIDFLDRACVIPLKSCDKKGINNAQLVNV